MKGTIFNIQRFCTNDGPGIRTVVFMKGCPLKCIWCHNPESQRTQPEIMYYQNKCTGCQRCVGQIENNPDFVCYHKAKEWCGKLVSSEEILEEVIKDKIFYDNSGGGITLSGGEPLYQFAFSMEILQRAKQAGIHTAIETCGFVATDRLKQIAEFIDVFLFDYKETDAELHKKFTGQDNTLILKNLEMLDSLGKEIILRCPIIPTCNDRQEHFEGICTLANTLQKITRIDIEPYHVLGEGKYDALGREKTSFPVFSDEKITDIIQLIQKGTSTPVQRG